jgi:hypothetical protein
LYSPPWWQCLPKPPSGPWLPVAKPGCRMYQAVGPYGKRQHTVAEIAEAVGLHRTTVYDYLKKEA